MIETDALVIGAGPVGLFQLFELGLLGIQAHAVDAFEQPGGQCLALYPDKLIYDVPGIPACTGCELVERLLQQISPFKTPLHLGQTVTTVRKNPESGSFFVETRDGLQFLARVVLVAAGVGAFEPRKVPLLDLTRYTGTQLFYDLPTERTPSLAHQHVVVVGGDEDALFSVFQLTQEDIEPPASVTLIHRRPEINAPQAQLAHLQTLRQTGRVRFIAGQITDVDPHESRLRHLIIDRAEDGIKETLPTDVLLVRLGRSPKLGPIAEWGMALDRKQVAVHPATFESSTAGLFAVGDINTYPGKKKLMVCGFHEATLAAFAAERYVHPNQAEAPLLYTTSSHQLHQRLGIGAT